MTHLMSLYTYNPSYMSWVWWIRLNLVCRSARKRGEHKPFTDNGQHVPYELQAAAGLWWVLPLMVLKPHKPAASLLVGGAFLQDLP